MGLMGRILGAGGAARSVGGAVTDVAEVFVGNRAAREAAEAAAFTASVGQYGAEFATVRASRFDAFMNGLNRLPRPLLVVGTLGLFVYAMFAPAGFSVRMQGLALVPEPLWWLLGAIVSFYFGARELHYLRGTALPQIVASIAAPAPRDAATGDPEAANDDVAPPGETAGGPSPPDALASQPLFGLFPRRRSTEAPPAIVVRAADPRFNAAVEEWRQLRA